MVDISSATNIAGTKYDSTTPVSPGGVLDAAIDPAAYQPFVSLLNATEIGRFGLHNGRLFAVPI